MDQQIDSSPHFNLKPFSLNNHLLEEILNNWSEKNNEQASNSSNNQRLYTNQFRGGIFADVVLFLCEAFDLNVEAQFLSIELFNRFMSSHMNELVTKYDHNPKAYREVMGKIRYQVVLRILSCIQIAHKLSPSKRPLSCAYINKCLATMGYKFREESVLSSEMRVLTTLNWEINITTPYHFLGMLLEVLGRQIPELHVKSIYYIGVSVLYVYYRSQVEIYEKLYETMSGRTKDLSGDLDFAPVENDWMYLASSLILASVHIWNNEETKLYGKVRNVLSVVTRTEDAMLDDFAIILFHFSVK